MFRATKYGWNPNTSPRCSVHGARRSIPAVGMQAGDSGLRGGGIPHSVGIGDSPTIRGTIRGIAPVGGRVGGPDGMAIGAIGRRTTIGSTVTPDRITADGVRAIPAAVGTTDTVAVTTAVAEEVITIMAVAAVTTTEERTIVTAAITMAPAMIRTTASRVPRTIPTGITDSTITTDSIAVVATAIIAVVEIPAASAEAREDIRAAAAAAAAMVAVATTADVECEWCKPS